MFERWNKTTRTWERIKPRRETPKRRDDSHDDFGARLIQVAAVLAILALLGLLAAWAVGLLGALAAWLRG